MTRGPERSSVAGLENLVKLGLADYHHLPAVGSTMLKTFRESPGLFNVRYVTKTDPAKPLGGSAVLGSLLHCRVEGQELKVAKCQARSARAFKEFRDEHGELACTEPEAETVEGAMSALLRAETPQAKLAKHLLLDCPGRREISHFWTHRSGEDCKVRFDSLPDVGKGLPDTEHSFADLKFVEKATFNYFTRISASFDRHCQAALYSLGYRDLRDAFPVVAYVIIGQQKPHPIKVCTISERFLEIGFEQIQHDLAELHRCRESGQWFDDEELEAVAIHEMEPPYWLEKQHRERFDG